MLRVLGVDPGTVAVGFALVESEPTVKVIAAELADIRSPSGPDRLEELHLEARRVITSWKPAAVAIERLFFAKNTKTALAVAEARGALLLTFALAGITVYEYTPLEVKKQLTGDGRADKTQIKKMLHLIAPETRILSARDDVFDAIAIALVCCHRISARHRT